MSRVTKLFVTLLGGFEARVGAEVVRLPTKKSEALLAYLAVRPGYAHQRDKLAALLWGDTADEQARGSLRQALSLLGKALAGARPPCLASEGRTVTLVADAVDVDVVRFEAAVAAGTPESLEQAAALYRADLLAGLTLNEAAFEEWLLTERERLREIATEALTKLLAHHQGPKGSAERAIQAAVRLLALDPCQEAVHRALMRLYGRQGRHGAALRQYQICVAALQRELGAEPEAETKRLYREILQRRTAEAAPPARKRAGASRPQVSPAMPSRETGMIGRAPELGRLTEVLEEAWSREGRIAIVAGEAGIGKTRLTEELSAVAIQRGGRVMAGRCYETEQILPFAPWVEALRGSGLLADEQWQASLAVPARAVLGRVFPEVAPAGAGAPREPDNPLQLFEGLAQLVVALAAGTPLLVIVEDLHWADDMSLRFLAFLGRRAPAAKLLVVGTAREEEIVTAPSLRRTLDELRPHPSFTSVVLAPLSGEETAALVKALAKAGAAEAAVTGLSAHVWRSSEGNPFVAVETMRAIQAGVVESSAAAVAVPGTVRELIVRRLERLSERGRHLAATVAVAGGPVEFALLARASGLPDGEAADGLEELVRHRVVHGVGERFDFTHDRVRRVVDDALLAPRRAALHAAIAEALEALHEGALEPVYDRLAYHFARTDRDAKAVEYLARFAEQAARGFAHGEAAAALEQALAHAERLPAATRDVRCVELGLRLAFSLSVLGRWRDILAVLGAQRARVDRLDRPDLAGPYHFRLGLTLTYLGAQAKAAESALAALHEARRADDRTTMGRAQYLLALKHYWTGELQEGAHRAQDAIALLDGSEDRHFLGLAYWVHALNCHLLGDFPAALEAAGRVEAVGHALNDPRLQSFAAWTFGLIHATRGDADTAISACLRAVETARDPVNTALASGYLGYAYVEQGNAPAAIEVLERACREFARIQLRQLESRCVGWLAQAYLLGGDTPTARKLAGDALAFGRAVDYWFGVAWAQRVLGRTAMAAGNPADAEPLFTEAAATFTKVGAAFELARTHLALAEAAHARGDGSSARARLEEAERLFAPLDVPRYGERIRALARAFDA